jgi:hypothetical protein
MRPLSISRIFFTYIIPLIPLCTIWDGIVSILHLHNPQRLLHWAQEAAPGYEWKAGKVRNRLFMNITFLTGMPAWKD